MKKTAIKVIILSILLTLVSYALVDKFLIPMPIWKYLIIEGIFMVATVIIDTAARRG